MVFGGLISVLEKEADLQFEWGRVQKRRKIGSDTSSAKGQKGANDEDDPVRGLFFPWTESEDLGGLWTESDTIFMSSNTQTLTKSSKTPDWTGSEPIKHPLNMDCINCIDHIIRATTVTLIPLIGMATSATMSNIKEE